MIDADWFDARVQGATTTLHADETLLASLHTEETDFVRFNHAQVRQPGTVRQIDLELDLIEGRKHTSASLQLTGDAATDDARISAVLERLREQRREVPDDPLLLINTEPHSTHNVATNDTPATTEAVAAIGERTAGHDMVGIYTSGSVGRGFANSLGQRNWFETSTFDFDWTLYLEADKAVKSSYAGFAWDAGVLDAKLDAAVAKLDALGRPAIDLEPGEYRSLLSPAALEEIVGLLTWNAFGIRSQRTSQSSLMRLVADAASLDHRIRISEHTANGVAPNFQEQGWMRPDEVLLVDRGKAAGALVSPRSAVEFDVATNGASGHESPESLEMSGGGLDDAASLEALDTGLWVGNLWYTNYSDLPGCRVTGMTRFATFWVEGGEVVAPVNVLRFDDTIYNLLGERLIDLTAEPELLVGTATYGRRSRESMRLPGALVDGMRFTL